MRRRTVLWTLALAVIFGFGWYKSYENQADSERRAAWDERMQRIQTESRQEYRRLVAWLRKIHSLPGGREQVFKELPGGEALSFRAKDSRDVASWMHPECCIRIDFGFEGDRLVSHSASLGNLSAIHPRPEPIATSSSAEQVRQVVVRWGPWVWLACLIISMALRLHYGLIAVEATLLAALACGVAWTVAPNYSITVRGILANDRLFFAAIMIAMSLALLAMRIAPFAARSEQPWLPRYGLRTLLALMGIVAVLLSMGPLGYFTICVAVIGAFLFFILLRCSVDIRSNMLRA